MQTASPPPPAAGCETPRASARSSRATPCRAVRPHLLHHARRACPDVRRISCARTRDDRIGGKAPSMPTQGRTRLRRGNRRPWLRRHERAPRRARGQDAVVAHGRNPGRWNERSKPGHEIHRRHDAVGASFAWNLQLIRYPTVCEHKDATLRERRACAIPHEPLAALVVTRRDAHRAVHIEAVACRGEAPLPAFKVRVGIVVRLPRAREEGSAGQGKLGAPLDRGRVGGLVAALLGGTLVEVVMTSQPSGRTVAHPLGGWALERQTC